MTAFTPYVDLALIGMSTVFVVGAVFARDVAHQTNLLAWAIMAHALSLN